MQIDIAKQPSIRVAAVRHTGPYTEISEAFERMSKIAQDADLFQPGALMLALYHDDPQSTPAASLRSDAAITLGDGVQAPAGSTEMTVPAGEYARATYEGPYSGLPGAWSQVMAWVTGKGKRFADGVSYELYRNDPTDTAPEDLITEIYVPLA